MKLKSSVCAALASLSILLSGVSDGKLTDITKPYLGVYECQRISFGSEDLLSKYSFVTLELLPKGKYLLSYCEKDDKKKTASGKYEYDKEGETLTLYTPEGQALPHKFPLKKGELTMSTPLCGKTLLIVFIQK